jgi:hypothetical protein
MTQLNTTDQAVPVTADEQHASPSVEASRPGDRQALQDLLVPMFKTLWKQALASLAQMCPHEPGDGSPNEILFKMHRGTLLRIGNDQIRQLPTVLQNFRVEQLAVREEVVRIDVDTPVLRRRV